MSCAEWSASTTSSVPSRVVSTQTIKLLANNTGSVVTIPAPASRCVQITAVAAFLSWLDSLHSPTVMISASSTVTVGTGVATTTTVGVMNGVGGSTGVGVYGWSVTGIVSIGSA